MKCCQFEKNDNRTRLVLTSFYHALPGGCCGATSQMQHHSDRLFILVSVSERKGALMAKVVDFFFPAENHRTLPISRNKSRSLFSPS